LLIDPADVAARITERTAAIVAVDYAGQTCDYRALRELADRHNVALVADSCHALGGTFDREPVAVFADMVCFSFHPVKQITTGEGGMVATNDERLAQRLAQFRNHGIATDHHQRAAAGNLHYDMSAVGFNYRLSDIHCALGLSQLNKLPGWTQRRAAIAARYREQLANVPQVEPLQIDTRSSHGHHLFVIRWKSDQAGIDRDQAIAEMRSAGINANIHYRPVYWHGFYRPLRERPGFRGCPQAEAAFAELISLPIFPAMTDGDVDRVCMELARIGAASRELSKAG
jgi:perosamine synthetase